MAKNTKGRSVKEVKGKGGSGSENDAKHRKASQLKATDWKPWRIGQQYERPENHEDEKLLKANAAFKRLSGGKK